jgi:hypothetical protein
MQDSRIYSDFSPEIAWIKREVARDVQSLGPSDQSLARFYTAKRLRILQGREAIRLTDRRMGRPIPYLALWLSDALGLTSTRLRRLSGLSLLYSSIAATIRDDIGESGSGNNSGRARLERFWSQRYTETLREVFPDEQEFKKVTSTADTERRRFEDWNSRPLADTGRRPFSAVFLRESSRYLVACALPPLIAVAHAAGRKEDVPRIANFLTNFSMGWKIFDDLMDWEADLVAREMNRSSVLIYVWNTMGKGKAVERFDVLSWFLNKEFVGDAYGAMIGFFLKARSAVASFDNSYLYRFMEEQIGFQTDKRDSLLGSAALTLWNLNEGLRSVLGPKPLVGRRRQ